MNFAELFVTLGVKGAAKAKTDIAKTKDEMVGLSKKSIGAIAALAGVSLGLGAIYHRAVNSGIGLNKFSTFMGKSSKELQKWQYVALKANVTGAEIEDTFRNISDIGANFELTGNMPAELNKIASIVGGFDVSKLGDAEYTLRKIRTLLQSNAAPKNILNALAAPFVSPSVAAMLSDPSVPDASTVPDSAIVSDSRNKTLAKVSAGFDQLVKRIEVAMSGVAAAVGPELLTALNKLVPTLSFLATETAKLTTRIAQAFAPGWSDRALDTVKDMFDPDTWQDLRNASKQTEMDYQEELRRKYEPYSIATTIPSMAPMFAPKGAGDKSVPDFNQTIVIQSQRPVDAAMVSKAARQGAQQMIQKSRSDVK